MPPGDPIPARDLPRFAEERDRLFAGFAQPAIVAATQ
jgi:hypothetical protein